ncbi:hypothetical protein GcC1_065030, partial [Golovinomyces cichoracearum]
MLKGDIPLGNCASKELCTCPMQLQKGIICADRIADRLENSEAIMKDDITSFYWLDKVTSAGDRPLDVLLDNPLLDVGEAKKLVNSKGRSRNIASYFAKEKSIHDCAQGVFSRKTAHNTISLGSKKGDKAGKTSSSSQRVISAAEHY